MIVACESTTESDPESLTGFWQANEVAQHFWLEQIQSDSLSGFGQLGIPSNLGLVIWEPITIRGNMLGNDISLSFTLPDSVYVFEGKINSERNFLGKLVNANDTISVSYDKRITYNWNIVNKTNEQLFGHLFRH